jgi:hypothetical protein
VRPNGHSRNLKIQKVEDAKISALLYVNKGIYPLTKSELTMSRVTFGSVFKNAHVFTDKSVCAARCKFS